MIWQDIVSQQGYKPQLATSGLTNIASYFDGTLNVSDISVGKFLIHPQDSDLEGYSFEFNSFLGFNGAADPTPIPCDTLIEVYETTSPGAALIFRCHIVIAVTLRGMAGGFPVRYDAETTTTISVFNGLPVSLTSKQSTSITGTSQTDTHATVGGAITPSESGFTTTHNTDIGSKLALFSTRNLGSVVPDEQAETWNVSSCDKTPPTVGLLYRSFYYKLNLPTTALLVVTRDSGNSSGAGLDIAGGEVFFHVWQPVIATSFGSLTDHSGAVTTATKSASASGGNDTQIYQTRGAVSERVTLGKILNTRNPRLLKARDSQRLWCLAQKLDATTQAPGVWKFFYSDQNARTNSFQETGMAPFDSTYKYGDPCFVGSILCAVAVDASSKLWFRKSSDNAASWSAPVLIATLTPPQLCQIKPQTVAGRLALVVMNKDISQQWKSLDLGRTWPAF